jgi:mono/diheme cytochrome c family protein
MIFIRLWHAGKVKRPAMAVALLGAFLLCALVLPGCAAYERWKAAKLRHIYGDKSVFPDYGMSFQLAGNHTLIGVGMGESAVAHERWKAHITMSGPELEPGDDFQIFAHVNIVDKDILRIIAKSKSPEIYMVAVISPLYDAQGHFRQFSNIQSSCLLTPTGLPIETLQENLPSRFKQNHYVTPWEIVARARPSQVINGDNIVFSAFSKVPRDLPPGHYRMAIEFGARISGHLIKLELVPYLGSVMLREPGVADRFLTANATEKTKIHILHSPVFRIGDPAPPKMPWTLFGDILTNGPRGIVSNQDKAFFAINYSGLRFDKVIVPMKDERGKPIVYRIEPDFPTQNENQELFEKTMFYGNIRTVLSHIELDPVRLKYNSGYLDVTITAPSGKTYATGRVPFKSAAPYGATTNDKRFDYTFDEYGHYQIEMAGVIEDQGGTVYYGGGTYDVWVARPLSMSTSAKPGMPYMVGNSYSPRVTVHPGAPAHMEYSVKLFRNSSLQDVKTWTHEGVANRFGYYFPAQDFEPMVFDAPGEYVAEVTATYRDEDGVLWMGAQKTAGVVASADSDITVHGDRMGVQSRPFDPDVPLDFSPRYELKAGGYAGTPEINDMTMTQIRMGFPYNRQDMLFFSPALLWNVGEIYPLLSFSTTDPEVEKERLARFAPFEEFVKSRFGESIEDLNDCWGRVHAVDACRFLLLDMMDSALHKSADNLTVMSAAGNGYQPHAFQQDPEILNYYYSSSIKPGLLSRYMVSDSTNSTAYWIITPNYFGRQFGAGEGGDIRGDIYRFMGGVVYRNLTTGVNKYGIYHAGGVVGDPRDENNRIEAPLRSPLLTAGGRQYYIIAGMSPEQGALYETGDRIVGGGFIIPSIEADVEFRVIAPDGKTLVEKTRTSSFGLFSLFKEKYILDKPGLYKVFARVSAQGKQGGSLGKPDFWYHVYVVDRSSPYELDFDLPVAGRFDITDALEIKGMLPRDWAGGKVYYTVVSPGIVYSDGELPVHGRQFTYRYVPLHANVFYPSLEVYDIVNNRPGGADTIVLSFFADGVSQSGERITAGGELLVRGDKVFYDKGKALQGPPPKITPTPMYSPFSLDNTPYVYKLSGIPKIEKPEEYVAQKCGSCHSGIGGRRTYGEWKKIVNWHMDRNELWLRDYNRRNLVNVLAALYPAEDTAESRQEEALLKQGEKLYEARCLSCHPSEPSLDRSRSRMGWDNILTRHVYWQAKWKAGAQYKMFRDPKDKDTLLEYLNLVAGSEAELPAGNPQSPEKLYQKLCFDCHATTLGTYQWSKADFLFLRNHIQNKIDSSRRKQAAGVVEYLLKTRGR